MINIVNQNIVGGKNRPGLQDIWNAFMCEGSRWTENDIPICPTILNAIPDTIVTWTEAKSIYRHRIKTNINFKDNSFVCFYEDDYKFDGSRVGIWANPKHALKILSHFRGIITPDFSTYQDFPYPLKIFNTFRMRVFGCWCGNNGLNVINNVRWGTSETYCYCFDGIEKNSVVAIGTVGGSPRKLSDRKRFEEGLTELIKRLSPKVILVYGSDNYPCFTKLRKNGISIHGYPGITSRAFKKRGNNYE